MRRASVLGAGLALAAWAAVAGPTAGHRFESIEGGVIDLGALAGGPVLVVNTASRCGFVGQFDGLQALHERYRDRGLTVIGVPSDSFRQELEDEAAVEEFCEVNFGIDFPMTEITPVVGADAHPFYVWARAEGAAPMWNFHKILLDGEGQIAGSFGATVEPDAPELTGAIEGLLAGSEATLTESFALLGQFFQQDFEIIYGDISTTISIFTRRLDGDEAEQLKSFLRNNLANKSDAELRELWDAAGSNIYFHDGGTRHFLTLVLEELKKEEGDG